MKFPKLFIGPMSKNVVDAVIEYSNETGEPLGLIPSRRQVDFNSGYVNHWTTSSLHQYVKARAPQVLLVRDHGGPFQGERLDHGYDSFYTDTMYMDIIHVDPWKEACFEWAKTETKKYIEFCYSHNPDVLFEIGTEEAIHGYEADQLNDLIKYLKEMLPSNVYKNIKYAVIQSGTSIKDAVNTGAFSELRLFDMLQVCAEHELLSKEHNGDYLDSLLIKQKFVNGLSAINIAPEFGQLETLTILDLLKDRPELVESFYKICYDSGKWKKWVSPDADKETIIKVSGHYVFSNPQFKMIHWLVLPPDVDIIAKLKMVDRIKSILE